MRWMHDPYKGMKADKERQAKSNMQKAANKVGFNHAILLAAKLADDMLNSGKASSVGD